MKIENVMTRPVRACAASDSLATAALHMWEGDLGIVPVIDAQGRLLGVVTDRDVCMSALFTGAGLADIPVARAMARELETVRADGTVHDALERMRARQLRRLPVVDDEGRLVGMLSLADAAALYGARDSSIERELHAEDLAQTLSAISRTRSEEPTAVMIVEVTPRRCPEGEDEAKAAPARRSRGVKGARGRSKSKKA